MLPTLRNRFGLVFTSPPYNLGNTTGGGMPGKTRMGHYAPTAGYVKRGGMGKWSGGELADGYGAYQDDLPHAMYVAWQQEILRACWRLLSDCGAIFYNHKPRVLDGVLVPPTAYVPIDLPIRQEIIWARAGGTNFSPAFYVPTHERLVVIAKPAWRLKSKGASGVGDVWYIPQESRGEGPDHPAPFPLKLPARAIETTAPSSVLDPFAGRGTTLKAAKMAGVHAVGVELDERHCEAATRWLAQEVLPL